MKKINSFLMKHRVSTVFALLTLAIMCVIFCFSAQAGGDSAAASRGFSRFIAELIVSGFDKLSEAERDAKILQLVPIVRKGAHFLIFCALGFFSNLSVRSFAFEHGRTTKFTTTLACALFCLVYAISDEVHQLFVAGRDGNVTDVLIDFSGSIIGIAAAFLAFILFMHLFQKNKKIRGQNEK